MAFVRLSGWDPAKPIVIDPVLSYSTFLGGSGADAAKAIAIGPDGSVYVAGNTRSADFALAAPLQSLIGGGFGGSSDDVFVAKLNPSGTALVYSTFIGGQEPRLATLSPSMLRAMPTWRERPPRLTSRRRGHSSASSGMGTTPS